MPNPTRAPSTQTRQSSLRALITVGDARLAGLIRQSLLNDTGTDWTIDLSPSATDAAATAADYDVALVDLGETDTQDIALLRAIAPRLPLIALADHDGGDVLERSQLAGADDYLVKKRIDPDSLERSIRHAMARASMQEELRQTIDALDQSNHDLEEFAAAVAHDLRAPIRTARLLTDRLVSQIPGDDAVAGRAGPLGDRVDEALDRLDGIVNGLLEYARLRTEQLDFTEIDLNGVADQVARHLSTDIAAAGATLRIGPLPRIVASGPMIGELITNLIENSLKYRIAEIPPVIDLRAVGTADGWTIRITDNGPGIPTEYREQVFELLQRLHGRGEVAGLGLGLTFCRRIVQRHGGTIRVENPNHGESGCAVEFTLPCRSQAHPVG